MSAGIRPQDEKVFAEAAKLFQVWLVLRQGNPSSFKYIGLKAYFPKPITCKAKTADRNARATGAAAARGRIYYETSGLVIDPTVHKNLFDGKKTGSALEIWNQFKLEYLDDKASGYTVNQDATHTHFGCVQLRGKYLYSDYDLYDIIVVGHETANLALITTRDGAPNFTTARQNKIEDFVNDKIGAEMVHHGGQFQFSEHTNDIVEIFGPEGETFVGPAAPWYARHFPKRRAPGPTGGFITMFKK
jgi:hypothetical protein